MNNFVESSLESNQKSEIIIFRKQGVAIKHKAWLDILLDLSLSIGKRAIELTEEKIKNKSPELQDSQAVTKESDQNVPKPKNKK